MDSQDKKFTDLVDVFKSWLPRKTDSAHVSRDFWMPDESCRVCYECDCQFTVFNRRHHCRVCGRVFCSKCTANTVTVVADETKTSSEEGEKIRACNYCHKQWEQGLATVGNGIRTSTPGLSPSPSAASLASTKSSATGGSSSNSTTSSMRYSTGPYQRVPYSASLSPHQSSQVEHTEKHDMVVPDRDMDPVKDVGDQSPCAYGFSFNRSDDDYDEYGVYRSDCETQQFPPADYYYSSVEFDEIDHTYGSHKVHPDAENIETKDLCSSSVHDSLDEGIKKQGEEGDGRDTGYECDTAGSLYGPDVTETEPVDFENNGLLWLPPDPEDEEDDREAVLFDDDDDDATGEWGYLRSSSSFGSGDNRTRDRSAEEHRKAMKNVVDGHFRALVSQLLQVENLPIGEEPDKEGWLDIITSLSWEAATLLKPDTSKGGGMDPGGYVKIKCLACGHRSESVVVKGIVCKKNVAHRRMSSKFDKPRFLILGGALEYQRVSNALSSFDTLLQQEMDHLKMAVAKIDAHHPNVLLVEKSVSRFAQEYLLAKDISLVLNIKKPLLERISRCTGAQIVPSIDHLSSQKLGYCDAFHVEKFVEEHGSAGQGGKKLMKTLMFFEGCPKPLGCTILLRGANGDELKKVKHVVQYGVFAAYHLALETCFLADEGASLPELPLKSPINVALPDKPPSIDRSISTIPGMATTPKDEEHQPNGGPQRSYSTPLSGLTSQISNAFISPTEKEKAPSPLAEASISHCIKFSASVPSFSSSGQCESDTNQTKLFPDDAIEIKKEVGVEESFEAKASATNRGQDVVNDEQVFSVFGAPEPSGEGGVALINRGMTVGSQPCVSMLASQHQDCNNCPEEPVPSKFLPSSSDHQSILVSLSTRCVWKGTVCERAHLFRIKYYGSFDKPLGRFLRDHLFDQSYRCPACEAPSEAHVHCYTHRQGSLTISVKRFPDLSLPGERDGKIWMWHRCLRCPRISGFPPATRRVVMSDAAWGLSFGKFLELSFSNHAAASRVASCGHSLHRDCLRFYGFGRMVACFRYASIDVHSVYLPPSKLDFNHESQEWIQKEANEVADKAELLFAEVLNALHRIGERSTNAGSVSNNLKAPESRRRIGELEGMLQREKTEFEESLHKILHRGPKKGQPLVDILEINRLRRQLLFQSYIWDQRLIYASSLDRGSHQDYSSAQKLKEKDSSNIEKMKLSPRPDGGFTSADSLADTRLEESLNQRSEIGDVSNQPALVQAEGDIDQDPQHKKEGVTDLSTSSGLSDQSDPLDSGVIVRRVLSEGNFRHMENLSDTLDAAWTGENHPGSTPPKVNGYLSSDTDIADSSVAVETLGSARSDLGEHLEDSGGFEVAHSLGHALPTKHTDTLEDSTSWMGTSFLNFYRSFNKNSSKKFDTLSEYSPVYISSFRELEHQGGARFLLPVGVNDTVVPVYDDEPTSIIAYALVSQDYHAQISDDWERPKDGGESSVSLPFPDSVNLQSITSLDDTTSESLRSLGSTDDSFLSLSTSRNSLALDPLLYTKSLHVRVSFTDDGPLGKVKYNVTCYYAKRFDVLRRTCCPSELDFIRSLSRCKKWGAQGGKSNVFFAKTLDDRFIIKQVTKTELESFIKFAPEYFKYLSESISSGSPTCLAKILGIYQVITKHLKGGKESRMDVLVMENLLFDRNVTRLYDLKGSSRSRYNPDSSGSNKVLLDQNLIEAMPTSPIFVGNKAKRLLERAVWNDTAFLASIDVMDYSLLVGVDGEKHELVLGIIDFMRQYTWDKHLETWVKASGILGGQKTTPTVISPKQYKKRFRKAMAAYFLMVPDQWSPPIASSGSQSDLCEETTQAGTSLE